MAYINTDRTGKFLLAASYIGAKLAIYPINAQSIVEARATQILDTKPKAHCVVIDAGNKNVYVPVLGGDIVMELKFDPVTGTVSPNGPGEVATKAGAGPRHLTFHPNGKFAYLITETTATIGTYAVDPASGTLNELQFIDTNEYREQQPAASDIHVTPDGKFLYGAERKTSMLIGFKIDPDKGTLTQIGRFPTEKTPCGFAIYLIHFELPSGPVPPQDPQVARLGGRMLGRRRHIVGVRPSFRPIGEKFTKLEVVEPGQR
jgi:6-phosphogluconolactonase